MFINEYNADKWPDAQIIIEPSGQSNKKYGEGVYRFAADLTLPILMPKRGWEVVKKGRGYVHLRPPAVTPNPPFVVTIKVPTKEQAIEIANTCYLNGELGHRQIGEWPAFYRHKHQQKWNKFWTDNGEHKTEQLVDDPQSSLTMGEYGIWRIELKKKEDGSGFTYYEQAKFVGREEPKGINRIDPSLLEGKVYSIEQTKYERDLVARQKCIEYYGIKCQICDFDFEKSYGSIGEGYIHVHHIEPISTRGGEYAVDPIKDLIPLCPNCHAMVHRRRIPFSIEEIREVLKKSEQ